MRWFKHFSDNHRGKSVQYMLDELGYFGPFFKDTILEMCAEKLERITDRDLVEDDCEFVFHRRVVGSAVRAKPSSVARALDAGQSCNFWKWSLDGDYIKISAPILLDLLDYDQKKSRQRRAAIAPGNRLEKSRVEKSREEKILLPDQGLNAPTFAESPLKVAEELKISKNSFIKFENDYSLANALPLNAKKRWAQLYPDHEFLTRELLKAFNWYENNPVKQPKTIRGWVNALGSWFERGWPKYAAQINGNKSEKIDWDLVFGNKANAEKGGSYE